jgi:hypothetical protein
MRYVWPLLILVALTGWGSASAWLAKRLAGVELRSLGEVLALGVAVILAIAGVVVAIGAFSNRVVYGGMAIGIGCALLEIVRRMRLPDAALKRRFLLDVPIGAVLIAAILLLALWSTANFHWDPCDDDVAYLYLAKRLLLAGNLLDPMNNRRLTSLGGMSALQALFLVRLPDTFLPITDLFLGPVMILFSAWRSRWGRWSIWGVAATLLVAGFPSSIGTANTSPTLIPIGLGIAACSVAVEVRVEDATPRARMVLAGIVGLLVGGAATLRPQFGFPLGLVALVMLAWPPLDLGVVQRLAGLGAGLVAVLVGWSVASWRAVSTPLFPIVPGNFDPSWPAYGPPGGAPSLPAFLAQLAPPLLNPPWAVALLLSTVVVVLVLLRSGIEEAYRRWGVKLQVTAAVASAAWVVILVRIYWTSGSPTLYLRFWAPVVMTAILVPLVLVDRTRDEHSRAAPLAAFAIAVLVGLVLAANPLDGVNQLLAVAHDTIDGQVTRALYIDRYVTVRADYAQAAGMIPPGSRVLAAVDVPSLLIRPTYELNTLDIPGSTSPAPHLPYFRGTEAKLTWLRDHGYDYVVAVDPSTSFCLYNGPLQVADSLGAQGPVYKAWSRYYLDWFDFLANVSESSVASSTRVGSLIVVKL